MALKESPYNKPSMALKTFEQVLTLFRNEFMNRLAHALKKENQYQCHVKYNSTKPRYSDQQIKQNSM